MSQSAGDGGAEHEIALHRTPDLDFTKHGMDTGTTVREFVFVSNDHGVLQHKSTRYLKKKIITEPSLVALIWRIRASSIR